MYVITVNIKNMVIEIENKTCYETIRQYFFENGKSSALFRVLKTAIQKREENQKHEN